LREGHDGDVGRVHVALLVRALEDRLDRVGDVLERVFTQSAAKHAERRAAGRELVVWHCRKDGLACVHVHRVFEDWAHAPNLPNSGDSLANIVARAATCEWSRGREKQRAADEEAAASSIGTKSETSCKLRADGLKTRPPFAK